MSAMSSLITSLTIVYWTVYSGEDQRKHQNSASLAFMRGIHRSPVNSRHKGPVTRKMFPFDDVIMWTDRPTSSWWLQICWCQAVSNNHADSSIINTLRPRQNGHRFADDTFKRIFLNENVRLSIKISLKFVPKGPINNIPSLVQIMALMVSLPTHICVTRPRWVS